MTASPSAPSAAAVDPADPLCAPAGAVLTRSATGAPSLGDCARAVARRPSPKLIAGAILAGAVARTVAAPVGWRDLVVVALLLAVFPLTEWAIHVYLLHSPPLRIGTRRFDLPTTREHRAHHEAPGSLNGVLIPVYGVLIFLAMIALSVWVLSLAVHALLGGDRLAVALTALLTSYVILGAYEWCHFLIHTPYRPRGRYFRSIWRSHRLHHYKNEHYWFGVTTNLGDRVLATNPEQSDVKRSRTARTLGIDAP